MLSILKRIRNEEGFTLIELMIVVAIIGILAAIAVPQFAQYRRNAYNSAGESDLKNGRLSQETLMQDWRFYGRTAVAALPGGGGYGAGLAVTGPGIVATPNIITTSDVNVALRGLQIPTSSLVTVVATTDATGLAFTMIAKHLNGNSAYGIDSDSSQIYREVTNYPQATPIAAGNEPASVVNTDDFAVPVTWVTY